MSVCGASERHFAMVEGLAQPPSPLIGVLRSCGRAECGWADVTAVELGAAPVAGGRWWLGGWGYRYRSGEGVKVAAVEKGGENAPGPNVHIWVCWLVSCGPRLVWNTVPAPSVG